MQAEIITIGDEILIGQIIDSNSAWMAQQLNLIGIDVTRITSISDKSEAITGALNTLLPGTKLVLITGGLGPTKDDITKHTLARYFGMELVYKEEIFAHIQKLFASFGRVPNGLNRAQAEVPEGCRVLFNDMGTAPGMLFQHQGRYICSMPGVPYEMKFIMQNHLLPIVEAELIRQHIVHKTVLTVGVPESELSEKLNTFEAELPPFVTLAYLPRPGMVRLRLTAKGKDEVKLRTTISEQAQKLQTILGKVVYGEDVDRLEQIVGEMLATRGETIATAESCTGGYIAHLITSVAGSSRYFIGSTIAYANEVKVLQLGVSESALRDAGAVSEQVILQMAAGARTRFNTTWALATSGIAGPDGGTIEKPVGTVWIALAGPDGTTAQKFQFGSDRERNIKKSAFAALDMLRSALL